jgi:hypothetical protein
MSTPTPPKPEPKPEPKAPTSSDAKEEEKNMEPDALRGSEQFMSDAQKKEKADAEKARTEADEAKQKPQQL